MSQSLRWTSADLELLPDDGKRYEIIDGELYVSKQPHWYHQIVCTVLSSPLLRWSLDTGAGVVNGAPGVIFADDDDVAPDLVWVSKERLATVLAPDGKLHAAPDLVVEVLSPGTTNERRDRDAKLKLYARRGGRERPAGPLQRPRAVRRPAPPGGHRRGHRTAGRGPPPPAAQRRHRRCGGSRGAGLAGPPAAPGGSGDRSRHGSAALHHDDFRSGHPAAGPLGPSPHQQQVRRPNGPRLRRCPAGQAGRGRSGGVALTGC